MMLAHAMEHVRLHRRLGLFVLSLVGTSIKWSMAGLMGVTAFLSMWINNSAATSIMIPAAIAIIDELENHQQQIQKESEVNKLKDRRQSKEIIPLESETFLIAVAYSAAIGGLATLVGTGPNIFVKGFTDELLPWIKVDVNSLESQKHLKSILKEQYKELGSLSWQEYIIAILFFIMVILWITRDFSSYPGWEVIFRKDYVTDATVAILIGTLPLFLPNKNPFSKQWEYQPIIHWDQLSKKFPWGVFMLQGAGLAIAEGFKASNLSDTVATFLQFIVGASDITIIFVVIVLSAIFTEFTSNLACATILFPILDSIAKTTGIHAARLILPSCMGVSLSFMLPIATPPNAMIFSSGNVRIMELIKDYEYTREVSNRLLSSLNLNSEDDDNERHRRQITTQPIRRIQKELDYPIETMDKINERIQQEVKKRQAAAAAAAASTLASTAKPTNRNYQKSSSLSVDDRTNRDNAITEKYTSKKQTNAGKPS
ncbi:unnamed protein product [Rotaria sp. Silwood2]|nr:unnamed protein product [Rotaria sp. Silwood2]